jgi:hypothetical protein
MCEFIPRRVSVFAVGCYAISIALLLTVLASLNSGCTTTNPAHTTNAAAPAYIVDARLNNASNIVATIAQTAGEATGTGPLLSLTASGIFAAIAGISGLIARKKSKVADGIAAAVASQGHEAVQKAMLHASSSPHFDGIAAHLGKQQALNRAGYIATATAQATATAPAR